MSVQEGAEELSPGLNLASTTSAIRPPSVETTVCVYEGMRGVFVDGEVFVIETVLLEPFPEMMITWNGLDVRRKSRNRVAKTVTPSTTQNPGITFAPGSIDA
jgi:hypothetical protein